MIHISQASAPKAAMNTAMAIARTNRTAVKIRAAAAHGLA
jgi:hypothetical protein